jgi:hypothetical protein
MQIMGTGSVGLNGKNSFRSFLLPSSQSNKRNRLSALPCHPTRNVSSIQIIPVNAIVYRQR